MGGTHPSQRSRKHDQSPLRSKWRLQHDCEWNYGRDKGPMSWWVWYPAAGGSHQSPINIDPEEAEYDTDLTLYPLSVQYADYCCKVLENTGLGCMVTVADKKSVISGGPLGMNKYRLAQFHFHWGATDGCGSEHLVNNKAYSAELHLVHWNTKYGTVEDAMQHHAGLAVIAVFIEKSQHNAELDFIVGRLSSVPYKQDGVRLDNIMYNPSSLIPNDMDKYWVYDGSLTTPPCLENVTWIVFWDPIPASPEQLEKFRQLRSHQRDENPIIDEYGGKILQNFRPVQNRGTRRIRTCQHNFATPKDFDQQFHRQGLFTTHKEIKCQFNREGIAIADQEETTCDN